MPSMMSRVELFMSCAGLPKMDATSKSDPFVVAYASVGGKWVELGRTEVAVDNQSPAFAKQLQMDFMFEEVQPLKFVVWDYDSPTSADYLGELETTLGRVMGGRGSAQTAPLVRAAGTPGGIVPGSITIRASEIKGGADLLRVAFKCVSLEKKDWFGSSDPFIEIYRQRSDGTMMKVWESVAFKNNLNPVWAPVDIAVQVLCNGDYDAPLVARVMDWNKSGDHEEIGSAGFTLRTLLGLPASHSSFPLVNAEKAKKSRGYKDSGALTVNSCTIIRVPTFLEYLTGGCALNLMVAIDFTGSNGDPRDSRSLHYMGDPRMPNEYQRAVAACGSILLEYDSDKRVPAFGFGGAINGAVSHCFPLNFNDADPEVPGVAGLEAAYATALQCVGLAGPTYFAPIVRRAAELASVGVSQASQRYTVLLLITDGQCNDIDDTTRAIVEASGLPLSIVIVGVGGADFSAMEFLDADGGRLRWGSQIAKRDIVQFVPFRKYAAHGTVAGAMLAKEVLAEVPGQLTSCFLSMGIAPNPPVAAAHPAAYPAAAAPVAYPGAAAAAAAYPAPVVSAPSVYGMPVMAAPVAPVVPAAYGGGAGGGAYGGAGGAPYGGAGGAPAAAPPPYTAHPAVGHTPTTTFV